MSSASDSILKRKVRGPKMRVAGFPALDPLCNTFASIAATLSRKELRSGIDVSVYGYEVVRHADYLVQLNAPSAIYLLGFPLCSGTGMVRTSPRLLGKVLDILLGGDGSFEQGNDGRPLTSIDISVYGRFVDLICRAFDDAVRELCGRSAIGVPQKTRFEEQPGMVRIAPDRAEVFVIKLNFHIADDRRGTGVDFAVPVATLEELKRDLNSTAGQSEAALGLWAEYMYDQVLDLPLPASARLGLGRFTVGELSRLERGTLLELPAGALDSIELVVETTEGPRAVASGRLGAKGRHKALRLATDPDPEFLRPLTDMKRPG